MASPSTRSPEQSSTLSFSTPPTSRRYEQYEVRIYTTQSAVRKNDSGNDSSRSCRNEAEEESDTLDSGSSPFVTSLDENEQDHDHDRNRDIYDHDHDQENISPSKPLRPISRVMTGSELSPLKILQERANGNGSESVGANMNANSSPAPSIPKRGPSSASASARNSRKFSSPRRFPVKVSLDETPRPQRRERMLNLEEAVREDEGLKHAIEIFEDEASMIESKAEDGDSSMMTTVGLEQQQLQHHDQNEDFGYDEPAGLDDTMVSNFSNFSAMPDMTMFARLGHAHAPMSRGEPSPSQTPRAAPPPNRSRDSGNTTNLLLDFTEQMRFAHHAAQQSQQSHQSPSRRGRLSPTKATPGVGGSATVGATPQRQSLMNLLDFDIPPMPTPRSIPTITPRELESLKSGFLSEISSLRASLSGKEAEVSSLKTAVGDAETRVGDCMEQLREARDLREQIAAEKEDWERRGREMESVLRQVKAEIVIGQRERAELEAKVEEGDKRREAAEMMAQEAESKMAGMRAGKTTADSLAAAAASGGVSPGKARNSLGSPPPASSPSSTQREVEMAVERVARELHALYKSKHETKVAALKKSYESRWEKKVHELESRVEELARDNEELRVGRNATMTRLDLLTAEAADADAEARRVQAARDATQIRELAADVERLEAVVGSVKADNDDLRGQLEAERAEKGELVILAEEMMQMQAMQSFIAHDDGGSSSNAGGRSNQQPIPRANVMSTPVPARVQPAVESNLRHSMSGPSRGYAAAPMTSSASAAGAGGSSGLKPPGSASRIGRMGIPTPGVSGHEKKRSIAGQGIPRPGSGMGMRSGIMSSIEKMGSYRGRGE